MPVDLPAARAPLRADRPWLGMILLMMALLFVGQCAYSLALWCIGVTEAYLRRHS